MGDIQRGAYGKSNKIVDFDHYNPLGVKIQPFKQEKVCGLCESKMDVIFPINFKACGRCAQRILERQDILKAYKRKLDMSGYMCDICGQVTIVPTLINTRVCHPCTDKIGKQTQKNMRLLQSGVRRVF